MPSTELSHDVPTVSYRALSRARTTLEDFVLSYFPLHGLDTLKDFLRFFDILVYVEASIYNIDEQNEDLVSQYSSIINTGNECTGIGSADVGQPACRESTILSVLRSKSLLDDNILAEFEAGTEYWRLERLLCHEMGGRTGSLLDGKSQLTAQLVHKASEAKSFDYRVLHYLLLRLIQKTPDPSLMEFLKLDETLLDIGDDLVDYEDDVLKNSFNIYRAYLHMYGRDAQMKLIERISGLERRHTELLEQLTPETQQRYKNRQREAAEVPGSEKWVFPHPIFDEHAYRKEVDSDPEPQQEIVP